MKKEYELLEKFRTDQVTIQPSLQKPKKSGFKEWTVLEIVGCIFSISLIVYGSYNMIFPPTESESAVQQVQWEENPSKQTDLVSTDQQYKDNYELDQDINKNPVESSSFDKSNQENPLKKLVLGSAEANELNQLNVEAQAGGTETQGIASNSGPTSAGSTVTGSTSQANTGTQRTSTQSNTTASTAASTAQRSSTASPQSNSTTSTQRSSTASTQSSSSGTSSQSTQPRRSSTTTAYQPRSSSSDYYTYSSYTPSSSSSSPSSSSGSYNTSTYGDSSNSRLVVVQPNNVSNEPGMIAGTP